MFTRWLTPRYATTFAQHFSWRWRSVCLYVGAIGTGSKIKLDAPPRYKLLHAFLLSKIYILFSNFNSVFLAADIDKILLAN
ncbi:hypothetical protein QT995_19465 [Microcoleus sp. S36b_A3]|uniref:hypothetical protein n=1 Tax=unclassified Microcoleus TaxID=2642155 RepID=UPI002FD101EE